MKPSERIAQLVDNIAEARAVVAMGGFCEQAMSDEMQESICGNPKYVIAAILQYLDETVVPVEPLDFQKMSTGQIERWIAHNSYAGNNAIMPAVKELRRRGYFTSLSR